MSDRIPLDPRSFRTKPSAIRKTDMRDIKSRRSGVIDTADYQYYNIRIYNDFNVPNLLPAVFKETRVEPILDKPNEYELAVVRFSIPASIPIFLWPQTVDPITGNKTGLPNNALYYVSLRYVPTNTYIHQPVVFVDNCVACAYPLGVYNYQDLIDAVNLSYSQAFTALKALQPGMPPTQAPFIALDAPSQLMSLYAQQSYVNANETQVFMSGLLYDTYFPNFYTTVDFNAYADPANVRFFIKDLKTNSTTIGGSPYYQMSQSITTLPLWNDFVALVLESDTIPIEPEYEPSQKNVVRRIITDFEPSTAGTNDRQSFQYFPQGAIRYYDLKSNYPMNQIDVRVYLQAKDGDTYLLQMSPGQYLSIKLQFRRKRELLFSDMLTEDNME